MSSIAKIVFTTILCHSSVSAFNILLFLIGTNHFERQTFEFLAQQLARRHHNTVTVKPILIPEEPRLVQPRLHLVREKLLKDLLPKRLFEPLQNVGGDVPWRESYEYDAFYEPYWIAHNYSCRKMLNSNLMQILASDQIDVAIVYAGNPCQLAIVRALNIPFIYFDLEGFTDETRIASRSPWNFEEFPVLKSDMVSFINHFRLRLKHFFKLFCEFATQTHLMTMFTAVLPCSQRGIRLDLPISNLFAEDYEIKRKFRGNFPNVNEIKRNAEFYFINTDILIEPFQSIPTNVIYVGGIHIDRVKPLFTPWNELIAEAHHGVIIVSLGTQVDTSKIPEQFANILFNVLSKFTKYRIFWRIGPKLILPGIDNLYNEDSRNSSRIPSHINITTFIPQNELLANRRTRLFITNGGTHSVMEAITHGVPMLGIPLYGFNRDILSKIERKGVGTILEKSNFTEATFTYAMNEILNSAKYLSTAREMSREIQRRPASAFERALHAIEHVARHRNAKFYRNPNLLRVNNTENTVVQIFRLLFDLNADLWAFDMISIIGALTFCVILLKFQIKLVLSLLSIQKYYFLYLHKYFKNSRTHMFESTEKKNK